MRWHAEDADDVRKFNFVWRMSRSGGEHSQRSYLWCKSLAIGRKWCFFYFHWHEGGDYKPYYRLRAAELWLFWRWGLFILPSRWYYTV